VRILITGGAGFVGSHLVEYLVRRGDEVVVADNEVTGSWNNLAAVQPEAALTRIRHDVIEPLAIEGPLDAVLHLASPASPPDYLAHPIATLDVGTTGTRRMLQLAKEKRALFLLASTSEVYGNPTEHPQREEYWGNVNSVGPRSVYDEAKRCAEAYTMAFHRAGLNTRIARIFNTYGPRMRPEDGRAIPNFFAQALAGKPLTVYGDGSQTRSLCYVDDLVRGLVALLESGGPNPVNLGNPGEITMRDLAAKVAIACGRPPDDVEYLPLPLDDPLRRCPDITRAREILGWEPVTMLEEGLQRTLGWFRSAFDGAPAGRVAGESGPAEGHRAVRSV
jgi:dTDP-glucose 4,6-dehydratase